MILIKSLITYVAVISLCSSLLNEESPNQIMEEVGIPNASDHHTTGVTYVAIKNRETELRVRNRDNAYASTVDSASTGIRSQFVATVSEALMRQRDAWAAPELAIVDGTNFLNGTKNIKYELIKLLILHRQHYLQLLNDMKKRTLVVTGSARDAIENSENVKSSVSGIQNRLAKTRNVDDENNVRRIKIKVKTEPKIYLSNSASETYGDISQINPTESLPSGTQTTHRKALDSWQKINVGEKTNSRLRYKLDFKRDTALKVVSPSHVYSSERVNRKNAHQERIPRDITEDNKKLLEISNFLHKTRYVEHNIVTAPGMDGTSKKSTLETNQSTLKHGNVHLQAGLLMGILLKSLTDTKGNAKNISILRRRRREGRGSSRKEGLMYLPVGGTTKIQCPTAADAAGISITQMAFLSMILTVFNIMANINNNINNNNNNNNLNSDNNVANNNAQLSLNVNNAAQINVMLPPPVPGRRKRKKRSRKRRDLMTTGTGNQISKRAGEIKELKSENRRAQNKIELTETPYYTRLLPNSYIRVTPYSRMNAESSVGNNMNNFSVKNSSRLPDYLMSPVESSAGTSPVNLRKKTGGIRRLSLHKGRESLGVGEPSLGRQSVKFNLTLNTIAKAVTVVKAAQKILLGTPALSTECMGLQMCQYLTEGDADKWMYALSSFFLYCRSYGWKNLTLKNFLEKALKEKQCSFLFSKC